MKITEIKTKNKIRDFKICHLWMEGKLTNLQISQLVDVSERCVGRVVYKNRGVLKLDREFEKSERTRWLKSQLNKSGDTNKDSLDIMNELRKEIEGDTKIIANGDTKIVIVYPQNQKEADENRVKAISSVLSTE